MAGTLYLVATPDRQPGGPVAPGGGNTADGGFYRRRGYPGVPAAAEPLRHPQAPWSVITSTTGPPQAPPIAERLLAGESCALVTDAGTPAISDPGEDLVRLCGQQDITVQAIPGCCAAVCALAVSGLPTGRFCFEGFLSANKKERRARLEELRGEERTMVFHEAPHKLRPTLADMLEVLGDRPVALCRELTKLHEETVRTTLSRAVAVSGEGAPRRVCTGGGRGPAGRRAA